VWAAAAKRDEAERALTQSKEIIHALREAAVEVEAQRREETAEMSRVAKLQREKQQARLPSYHPLAPQRERRQALQMPTDAACCI
tara:strand:- start:3 stop:257 length:255 start_codon:yes stop_codon:yes gene_type:complete